MRQTIEMQLTPKQQEAKDGIISYLLNPVDGFFLLYGFAGTGKTFTITYALNEFIHMYGGRVVLTAPVNKAVKVLERTLQVKADYMTIHSLLGLRPQVNNKTGEMEFKPKGDNRAPNYDAIIVDESSMLNEELFEMLVEVGRPIIFVGDYKQLRPIGKENTVAAPFRKLNRDQYNIKIAGLTEIIRQAEDSGIIPLSAQLRKGRLHPRILDHYIDQYEDLIRGVEQDAVSIFETEEYKQDPDYCKVIGYTNKKVNHMNKLIRDRIYDNPTSKIVQGERLVVNKPIFLGGEIAYTTNDEIEVQDFSVVSLPYREFTYKVYNTVLMDGEVINILHEDSQDDYDAYVEALKQTALATKESRYWGMMYEFMEVFADVSYSYAITCHKSQGSTYQHTFLCSRDLTSCRDTDDRQALWYTAVTRAAKTVTFI